MKLLLLRFQKLSFTITMDSELHGFGGYFECVLYKDVSISINPATHSKGNDIFWFTPRYFFVCNAQLVACMNEKNDPSGF